MFCVSTRGRKISLNLPLALSHNFQSVLSSCSVFFLILLHYNELFKIYNQGVLGYSFTYYE